MKNFNEKSIINMVENLFLTNGKTVKHANNLSYFSSKENTYFIVFGEKWINIFLNGEIKQKLNISKCENFKDAEKYAKSIYLEIKNKYCI